MAKEGVDLLTVDCKKCNILGEREEIKKIFV